MRATFFGIELGKRAILTQRTALDVTSHNIANANTEGYARQRAVLSATEAWTIPGFNAPVQAQQVGTGVDVTKIQSLRDQFVDEKIVNETTNLQERTVADDLMAEVEAIINEPNETTVRDELDKFWSAWEDLSVDPSLASLRTNVTEQAQTLVSTLQDIDTRLRRLQGTPDYSFQGSIEDQIQDALTEVNSLAHQLGNLNTQIERVEVAGGVANDLRDSRQALVEDLAKLINVDTHVDSQGHWTIRCGTEALVQHGTVRELSYVKKTKDSPGTISFAGEYPEMSDNPKVASAVLTHTADQRNITITVQQLAQAESKYSFLTYHPLNGPLSDFGISSGTFTVNGRNFFLDAEHTTIKDLAKTISEANLNINATLNESGQLVMTSTLTGTDHTIQTADGTSNLMRVLNLQTDKAAKNAVFNIGDRQYTTQSNVATDALPGAQITLNSVGVANIDLRPIVTGGKLKGLLKVRDGNIEDLRAKFDELAYRLVTEVNDVHRQGFGLDGVTGRNFFKSLTSTDINQPYKDAMKNLALEEYIVNDVNTVAASQGSYLNATDRLPSYNGAGDGKNAILIAQVKHKYLFNDGKSNFNDFYNETVTQAAVEAQAYDTARQSSQDLLTQLDSKRQEISGVSLDEELTNLIKFQQAYNAAARIVTTVDEMLDKIINQM